MLSSYAALLNDATPIVSGVVNQYPDLRLPLGGKRKLPPRLVITRDVASGYGRPRGRGTAVGAAALHNLLEFPTLNLSFRESDHIPNKQATQSISLFSHHQSLLSPMPTLEASYLRCLDTLRAMLH